MLAAASVVFDMTHSVIGIPIYPAYIDLAGFPWILSYFLFGFWPALLTSVLASVLISFGMTGIAGAGIKFVATMPQFLVFALFAMALRYRSSISFRRLLFFIPVAGVAILVRVLLSIGAGTYIFGPLFFHSSPDTMLQIFPPWLYVLLNVPQAIVDLVVAWLLAYRLNLVQRYATW